MHVKKFFLGEIMSKDDEEELNTTLPEEHISYERFEGINNTKSNNFSVI